MLYSVFVYIFLICFLMLAYSIRIQVKPEIFLRIWSFKGNLNLSKDWSRECDVPCVWTGNPDNADGVFYIIKHNQDARRAFEDKTVIPISIGGSTEGEHYHDLITIDNFRKYFTASALLDTRSDIPWLIKFSSYEEIQNVPRIENPIKKAVVAAFNCDSKNNRETIITEMSKIFPINRIGDCLRNSPWPMCGNIPCEKEDVLKRYMFCLAFENGMTPFYTTEKIHQCLRAGSLPVYYGAAHISQVVPEGSYIDMRDFESHTALAKYMVRVMENETLYSSYFDWKKRPLDPDFVRRNKPIWDYKVQCRVCRYVWVKQRGLSWDKVTQNATVYLNPSLNLNQAPYNVEEMEILISKVENKFELQNVPEFYIVSLISGLILMGYLTYLVKVRLSLWCCKCFNAYFKRNLFES